MKIAVMAGSFDPVTYGHTWVIERALDLADTVHVIIGINPSKKYMFTTEERIKMMRSSLTTEFGTELGNRAQIVTIGNRLVINYAAEVGATMLVRGIRNTEDFRVENDMNLIHKRLHPEIETAYFIPPRELTEVSSSVVKSVIGFDNWESAVQQYVNPSVLNELRVKARSRV
jgi:pantetheine-phosphate adenylyltransferase